MKQKIKIFRSDNSGEFYNDTFDSFLKKNGILHQRTNPYTQQNGICEQMNPSLVNADFSKQQEISTDVSTKGLKTVKY